MEKTINCYRCDKEGVTWEVGEGEWSALGFIEAGGGWLCLECDKYRCESCGSIVDSREDRLCGWCEESNVESHPKDHCMCCGRSIEQSVAHHREYGNYCRACSGKANRLALLDGKIGSEELKIASLEKEPQSFNAVMEMDACKDEIQKLTIEKKAIIKSLSQYAKINL